MTAAGAVVAAGTTVPAGEVVVCFDWPELNKV